MARKSLKQMRQDFKNLAEFFQSVHIQIANAYAHFIQENFQTSSFDGKRWPGRKIRSKQSKKSRALLIQSGRLRRSIRWKIQRTRRGIGIIFYTDAPYAKIHNEGGKITGTAKVKSHTRRTRRGKVKVKAHSRKLNITIPKRQFMGESQAFNQGVVDYITEQIERLLK